MVLYPNPDSQPGNANNGNENVEPWFHGGILEAKHNLDAHSIAAWRAMCFLIGNRSFPGGRALS
jgi:hypothetical protein